MTAKNPQNTLNVKKKFNLHRQNAALEVSSENCRVERPFLAADLRQNLKIYVIKFG